MPRQEAQSGKAEALQEPKKRRGGLIAVVVAGVFVAAAVVAVWKIFMPGRGTNGASGDEKLTEFEDSSGEEIGASDVAEAEGQRGPLYALDSLVTIDLGSQNHTPGEKAAGMVWDGSFFYWLEGTGAEGAGAKLSQCRIAQAQLYDSASGKIIDFEIYSDDDTGEIYKIVQIEKQEKDLLLIDYYYQDGKPYFIFRRGADVYMPGYATEDKVGERYYFRDDALVRWGVVEGAGNAWDQLLTPIPESWHTQTEYDSMDEETRDHYDRVEYNLLNLAYAVYDQLSSGIFIGSVTGKVTDSDGTELADVLIQVRRKGDDVLLYETRTKEDGTFHMFTYMDESECVLTASLDGYRNVTVKELILDRDCVTITYDNLKIFREGEPEHAVRIQVSDAGAQDTGNGNLAVALSGAEVVLREGISVRDGEIAASGETDESGNIMLKVDAGTYTAQIRKDGFATTYRTVQVEASEDVTEVSGCYLAPAVPEGQTGILLTWEGDCDLDLVIYTPYLTGDGDAEQIGGKTLSDEHGSYILRDNTQGCEIAYIHTEDFGSYRIYVRNYTELRNETYTSALLSQMGVQVCILSADGGVEEYVFPSATTGVVWEVAEISGESVASVNRVYAEQIKGSTFEESKEQKLLLRKTVIQHGSTEIYEYEYDSKGELIKETLPSGGIITYTIEYGYDSGMSVKEYCYNENWEIRYYRLKEYNRNGDVISDIYYNSDDTIEFEYLYSYQYNDANQMVEERCYYDGTLNAYSTYEYDAEGRITSQRRYDGHGELSNLITYEYNLDAMLMIENETDYFEGDAHPWATITHRYNENGTEIEYERVFGGARNYRKYNEHGDIIELIDENDYAFLQVFYQYEYDEDGYMLQCEEYYYDFDSVVKTTIYEYAE